MNIFWIITAILSLIFLKYWFISYIRFQYGMWRVSRVFKSISKTAKSKELKKELESLSDLTNKYRKSVKL
jgi:hypothetical protein